MSDHLILAGDEFLSNERRGAFYRAATRDEDGPIHGAFAADGAEFVY